jgi:tRNA modification GTPase
MVMSSHSDTIVAIATPVGRAGIGIVRVSGSLARRIAHAIFRAKVPVSDFQSHRLYLGHIVDPSTGDPIDEVLLSFMRSPHSYTCEDVVEINSHSGYLLLSSILQLILDQGARLAHPGEFTLRAFLNGRIDLTQAEAVVDLIHAQSKQGLNLASRQIQGTFGKQITAWRQQAVEILAQVEAAIDFPDEELELISRQQLAGHLQTKLLEPVTKWIEAHARKRMWVDGIRTVIVGRVNVGKSSLLNRLLDEPRAIVTPIPGTTRDFIESTITIDGLPLVLMDTAGFGEARDQAEEIGMSRTEQKLEEADLVLAMVDASRSLHGTDIDMIRQCQGKNTLVVVNKVDLPSTLVSDDEKRAFGGFPLVRISALTGQGIDQLRKAIVTSALTGTEDTTSSHAAPNLRHQRALRDAAAFFENAVRELKEEAPMEIVALEVKSGLDVLGEIVGETAPEEVLESIFSRFCIGK